MQNKLTLMIILRSILFWSLSVLSLPFHCLVAFLIIPLKIQLRHKVMASVASYFTFLLKHITGVKYQVTGLDNISKSPAIFAGNHQSAWETMAFYY